VQHHPTLRIGQHGMKIVGGLRARTQLRQIDLHTHRQAKQIDDLIKQMRPQIVPDAAARTALLAPALRTCGR
jgi:hypothetical protein